MKTQRGYYNLDMTPVLVILAIVSAVVGWGVIEGALWVLSHISVSWK